MTHDCEMALWNLLTCLVCPQSSESVDWGHPTLNRSERVLGVRFVCQLTGYSNFDLVIFFVWGVAHSGEKSDPEQKRAEHMIRRQEQGVSGK